MRVIVVAVMMIGASACAMSGPNLDGDGFRDCDASAAQSLVGQQKSDALGAEAMKRTGTSIIRWIAPGQPVSMDYRTDRLNMEIDTQDKVIHIRCG